MKLRDLKMGDKFVFDGFQCVATGLTDEWGNINYLWKDKRGWSFTCDPPDTEVEPFQPPPRIPLPEGFELAPDDHVMNGSEMRLDENAKQWRAVQTWNFGTAAKYKEQWGFIEAVARPIKKEPTYRPFNMDELPGLVGKMVCWYDDKLQVTRMIVGTEWQQGGCQIISLGGYGDVSPTFLLENYTFLDGSRCGVAE